MWVVDVGHIMIVRMLINVVVGGWEWSHVKCKFCVIERAFWERQREMLGEVLVGFFEKHRNEV